MERTQREYYLNEQMKAIQRELGDGEDGQNEIAELEERIAATKLSKEAREKAEAELKKLQATCRRCRPRPRWCATISTGCCRSRGA
jgi:ATP-dependent Lon protease